MTLRGYARKYDIYNGVGYIYEFENGYGASVVKHDYSYGGKMGLYEIAVLDSLEIYVTVLLLLMM